MHPTFKIHQQSKVWAKLVGHTFNQKLGFELSILHPFVNGLVPKKT
jgi:hypothetical protein